MKNTKQFYSNLGQALSTMKNSPFMKIGGSVNNKQQNNEFKDGGGLNYDANRLFDPKKYQQEQQLIKKQAMDNQQQLQYIKNRQKQQQEALQKIHYDLLKKNVQQDYQSELKKMEAFRQYETSNFHNIFGVNRGVCLNCGKCGKYEGCFNMENSQQAIQFMSCIKCQCPMNSHRPYSSHNPHQSFIMKQLIKCSIQDSHIDVGYNIFAFRYDQQKNRKNLSSSLASGLFTIMQALNHPLLSYRVLTRKQFQITILQTLITKSISQLNTGYLQALLSLLQNIKNVQVPDTQDHQWFDQLQINDITIDIKKLAKELLYNNIYNVRSTSPYEKIIVVLSVGSDFTALTQLLKSQSFEQQLKQYKYVYSSYKSKRECILAAQNFFPKKFSLRYWIYLLPNNRQERDKNSARFKDILDYNNCITYIQDPKNIERVQFQKAFSQFNTNKINFLLGQQLLSQKITRLPFKYVGKIGDSPLQIPFEDVPDYLTVSDQAQINKCLRFLYPEIAYSQRCIIILRPFLMNQNYQQIIVNLLRINKFTILKRVAAKVTQSQAAYLATLQQINDPQQRQSYINYMTSGVSQVILCSKRSGIYDAYALLNGCFQGKIPPQKRRLRSKPVVQIKKGKLTYEHEISGSKQMKNTNLFKSVRQFIKIEDILFPLTQSITHYLTNVKTGQIIKTQSITADKKVSDSHNNHKNNLTVSSIAPKMKNSLLQSVCSDNFNYWCMCSKSQTITEQLCSLFIPQCTLFQPITIILKPNFTHLINAVLNLLKQHKYHIIDHKKVQFSRILATQLIYSLQRVKITDKNQLKTIIDAYSSRQLYVICLSKVSGRTQIMRMFSQFNFLGGQVHIKTKKSHKQNIMSLGVQIGQQQILSDQQLKHMIIPVWNRQDICLSFISNYLGNLQDAVRVLELYSDLIHIKQNEQPQHPRDLSDGNKVPKAELFKIINYFVGSFYGVSVSDINLSTKIGILSYYILEEIYIAKQQSWYYSMISNRFSDYGPLLFQYRQIGQTILCIQSDKGTSFLEKIQNMYLEQKQKIQEKRSKDMQNQNNYLFKNQKKFNERKSLVLFLWSKKLFEMLLNLSKIQTQLKDYGEIYYKNGQHRGHLNADAVIAQEESFLLQMQQNFKSFPQIHNNIKKLLMSRCFKQRYLKCNTRLLPTFNHFTESNSSYQSTFQHSIRIVQKSHASKLVLMDQHQFLDPQNQFQQMHAKDLYSLVLHNIVPQIRTKYFMFSQIYMLLMNKIFDNQGDNYREDMYNNFVGLFSEMISEVKDLEFLQFQIYLRLLVEYAKVSKDFMEGQDDYQKNQQYREARSIFQKKNWILSLLRQYPNLRKFRKIDNDDVAGKKRKFLERKQYFIRKDQKSQEALLRIQQQYQNVDLNKFIQPSKQSVLNTSTDPFHKRLANTQNKINLLRDNTEQTYGDYRNHRRAGVNVEYQKNISQKQQLLKQKIKGEVQKFNIRDDTKQVLHETGLQKNLWYRRTKGTTVEQPESKTNMAIQKQIGKFMLYKKQQQRKILEKQI